MSDDRYAPHLDPSGLSDRSEDWVERLIRLADDGPEVPRKALEEARAAIRPVWRAEVRVWARRRWLRRAGIGVAAAAGIVLAASVVLRVGMEGPAPPERAATVARLTGEVELLGPHGTAQPLDATDLGRELVIGSRLRSGPDGRAALLLVGGQSLRLDHGTRLRLASAQVIELDTGAVYIDSGRGSGTAADSRPADSRSTTGSGLEVRTFMGIARDIGTQLEVRRVKGRLSIKVREGAVALLRGSEELEVRTGAALELRADGTHVTSTLAPHAPEWRWVESVAPPFEVDGRPVVAFLDWVSRETGRQIRFASPEVERFSATTTLHGTIEALRPSEALDLVLAGCGLRATRHEDRLLISWDDAGTDGI